MNQNRLREIFRLYYNKQASPELRKELMELLQDADQSYILQLIEEEGLLLQSDQEKFSEEKTEKILRDILQTPAAPTRRYLFRWLAAASVLLLLALGYWSLYNSEPAPAIVQVTDNQKFEEIEAPALNRAVITLADGTKVYLDNAGDGILARDGNVNLRKLADGQIEYTGDGNPTQINTLHNPRGSRVLTLILSDGTKIWLNSGSTLKYPVSFGSGDRKVALTGEAYFEVSADKNRKFTVSYPAFGTENELDVLGTMFNIEAFPDELGSRASLVEGEITVRSHSARFTPQPGQQVFSDRGGSRIEKQINMEEVLAWKNGFFMFSSADIETVLRHTSRWYDIEIAYEGAKPADRFSGKISREVNLSEFLKVLEYSEVRYRLEGRKIIISS